MILKLCAIFAAGLLTDYLVARYTRAVTERRPMFAASLASVLTVTNLTLLTAILTWTSDQSGVLPIASFAGGSWVGTYLTVRRA